jgi:hypothetical protein
VAAVATTSALSDTKAVSVNVVVAGGSIWLALLPPPPPPPPHAAIVRAQTMPTPAEADARRVNTRYKFMMHSIKRKNVDYPHEYRAVENWFIALRIFVNRAAASIRCARDRSYR